MTLYALRVERHADVPRAEALSRRIRLAVCRPGWGGAHRKRRTVAASQAA